ncbi:MAG: DUF4167 domain-containing protein [Pseudomonadota bacterium]
MKPSQTARRGRGRSGGRANAPAQRFSDGTRGDQRSRGNPAQLLEKFKSLARDALAMGDRVLAENYLQHADHYLRLLNERNVQRFTNGEGASEEMNGRGRRGRRRFAREQDGQDDSETPEANDERDSADVLGLDDEEKPSLGAAVGKDADQAPPGTAGDGEEAKEFQGLPRRARRTRRRGPITAEQPEEGTKEPPGEDNIAAET